MKTLTFVVPCYNEEGNVKNFYRAVEKSFDDIKINIELIFINDGSTDGTLNQLKKVLKSSKYRTKIINFSRNFGKEAAIYAGLVQSNGDYIVIIDADLQQPPHLVIEMLNIIEKNKNIDIVAYYQENRIENKFLLFFKECFYTLINKITDLNLKKDASDFRLFKKNVAMTILNLPEHNRFSKGIFAWIGFETMYLPYTPEKRINGKSSWNLKKLFKYGFSGILSYLKIHKLIFKFGILNILISLMVFIILIFSKTLLSYMFIFPFITFMFGLNFVFIGTIGEYIYRSYDESRNRPIYILKEVMSNEKDKRFIKQK